MSTQPNRIEMEAEAAEPSRRIRNGQESARVLVNTSGIAREEDLDLLYGTTAWQNEHQADIGLNTREAVKYLHRLIVMNVPYGIEKERAIESLRVVMMHCMAGIRGA